MKGSCQRGERRRETEAAEPRRPWPHLLPLLACSMASGKPHCPQSLGLPSAEAYGDSACAAGAPGRQRRSHPLSLTIILGSPVAQRERICLQSRRRRGCRFNPWVWKIPWRRAWQPTPVFLPGKSRGQRSPAGYSPWGDKELATTQATERTHTLSLESE